MAVCRCRRPLKDWSFAVVRPAQRLDGWWFSIEGTSHKSWGPFTDYDTAIQAEMRLFQRWNRAARTRGGWAWKRTPKRWVITVPKDQVVVGGLPIERAACTRHMSNAAPTATAVGYNEPHS